MGETVQDTGRGPDSVPWEMMVNTVIEEVGREGALINRARHPRPSAVFFTLTTFVSPRILKRTCGVR